MAGPTDDTESEVAAPTSGDTGEAAPADLSTPAVVATAVLIVAGAAVLTVAMIRRRGHTVRPSEPPRPAPM